VTRSTSRPATTPAWARAHTKTGLIYRPLVDGQTWALKRVTGTGAVLTTYTGFDLDGGTGGVTVSGGTTYGITGNGSSRTMTLRRVTVTGNDVGVYRIATGSTIAQCRVHDNTGIGVQVVTGQAIAVTASEFYGNGSDGLQAVSAGNTADRCAFYDNNASAGTAQCNMGTAGVATECIAEGGALIGIKAATAVRCSATDNGTDYDVATNTDPITGPVDWVDAAGGNFGITAASPAYHAGEPSAVLLDVVGVPYDATAPSIGSREFVEVPAALGPFEPFASSLWERLDVLDLVRIAIGTDGSDDVGQGQGWWADSYSADEYRIGWRTELLRRGVTGEEERIRQGLLGGLRFLVTDGHADRVEVAVERVGEALAATVTVHRDEAAGGSVSLRYPDLWNMVRDGS
jgi:phage gp46-like protein